MGSDTPLPYRSWPEPYRSEYWKYLSLRERSFAFLRADELELEALIRRKFPSLGYFDAPDEPPDPPIPEEPSMLPDRLHLHTVWLHFAGPARVFNEDRDPRTGHLRRVLASYPYAAWRRNWSHHPVQPVHGRVVPHVGTTYLCFYCRRWVKEDLAIARQVLALIDKVGSRNYSLVHWPDMTLLEHPARRGSFVIGHHAMTWLREASDRVAMPNIGEQGGEALRPGPEGQD